MNTLHIIKWGLLSILIIASISFFPNLLNIINAAEILLSNAGNFSPLLYALLMIFSILIPPLPSSPLAIIGGMVFGPWKGMAYTLIAATLGASIAFSFSRFFFREYFRKYCEHQKWYNKFEGNNERRIAYIVFLTRLMPQVSFDLVSYAAGLTRIRSFLFIIATFLGMIPIVFIFSFFGHFLEPYKQTILIILLASFIVYFVYRLVKK